MTFEEIKAQIPVVSAAWQFLEPAIRDGDIARAWPAVDPVLRLCWAQAWLGLNHADVVRFGYNSEEVADALTNEAPTHPLWGHFRRVLLRDLHVAVELDPATWGIGANTRVLGIDTELLYLQDTTGLVDGVWQPDEERMVLAIVMRLGQGQWRVLNLGSETIPVPGWPPLLSSNPLT